MSGDPYQRRCGAPTVERSKEMRMPKSSDDNMTYAPNSPLKKEMSKPQIKFIKHHSYGVRRQQERIRRFSNAKTRR
tara:strand:+ start:1309 stop:1536 length:228 start_codon:yes stop_codon:yes gene_type:complete